MNTTLANSLAKALPSAGRLNTVRASFLRPTRLFSTTPKVAETPKQNIEKQFLNTQSEQSANDDSPLSAITRMMQGESSRSSQGVSRDYSRMAASLEAEMLSHPSAGRSPPHHLHVYSHKHNTIITLTRPNGNPLISLSCGNLGFRKAGRGGYDPAYQLSSHVFGQIQERGLLMEIQRLEIVFRGFHQGREAFTKVLLGNEGKNIRGLVSRVADSTRIKFGGTRSRASRRLG